MESKVKRPFSFFSDFIPYYRQLRPITGSALTSILVSRLEFWFEKFPSGFYKFFEPCPGHKKYQEGDSWAEELAFSLSEFNAAFDNVGVSYQSKKEYKSAESKFKATIAVPKYEVEKKLDTAKNKHIITRKKVGTETKEVEMYYCRYHDRMENYTYYFKNPNKSIIEDAEAIVKRESRITVKGKVRSTVKRKVRFRYNGKSDFGKTESPIYSTLYIQEKTQEKTHIEDDAPKNGADKSVDLKIEKDNFIVLLDFWYSEKGEPNPGTVPPRFDRKKYTELVAERITEGWTWRQLSAAVRNYWRVVKSPAHYYKHQGSISWFIAKGIDQFWDELNPWENFKDKNKRVPPVGYNAPPEDLIELTLKEFDLA